jgi:hypothetical protein
MPRYLMETGVVTTPVLDEAERLVAHRFPEIAVERRYVTDDGITARAVWVCRAPSEAHLGRWAASAELSITSMCRIAADHRPASGGVNR